VYILDVQALPGTTLAGAVGCGTESLFDRQSMYKHFFGRVQIRRHPNFPEKAHLIRWPFIAGKQEALFGCKKIIDDIHSEKD
tara:strand:- start:10599 stop:10844 length:246 start_codon:yes stop_codon:yes gene_type:complete